MHRRKAYELWSSGRRLALVAFFVGLSLVVGCDVQEAADEGVALESLSPSEVRQTDDSGERLPFDTTHSRRWNSSNDGSSYEPCTALSDAELQRLGIDPDSVRDAAGTNGQTLRGCNWRSAGPDGRKWSVAQIVGDSADLASDKARNSSSADIWMSDVVIAGRTIGVHRMSGDRDCDTYVQSGGAAVNTIVMAHGLPRPPVEEICAKALEFTRATIGKMPR